MNALCVSGSDKEAILDLVTSRSNRQRQEVIAAYKNCFGKVQWYLFSFLNLYFIKWFKFHALHIVTHITFRHYVFAVSTGPD